MHTSVTILVYHEDKEITIQSNFGIFQEQLCIYEVIWSGELLQNRCKRIFCNAVHMQIYLHETA